MNPQRQIEEDRIDELEERVQELEHRLEESQRDLTIANRGRRFQSIMMFFVLVILLCGWGMGDTILGFNKMLAVVALLVLQLALAILWSVWEFVRAWKDA